MDDQLKTLQETVATLLAKSETQEKTISKLVKDHALLAKSFTGISTKTEIAEKPAELPKIPKSPVKIGEKKYSWNVPVFQMPGSTEKITAEEASTDPDLLAKIVAIEGQGLLKELV